MKSIRCPKCGMTNWAEAENCKGCQEQLQATGAGLSTIGPRSGLNSPRLPLYIAAASLVFLVLSVCTIIVVKRTSARIFNPYGQYEAVVRASREYREPFTVEAIKQPSPYSSATHSTQEANKAARALEAAGLITITTSKEDVMSSNESRSYIDQYGRVVEVKPSKLGTNTKVDLKLTERGQREATDWEIISEKDGRAGWRVPLGNRELIEIESVRQHEDTIEGEWRAAVRFRWQWKPNLIGEYFDRSTDAYRIIFKALGEKDALSFGDSRDTAYATAQMHSSRGVWIVDSITWNVPSPKNEADLEKLEELMEQATRPRG